MSKRSFRLEVFSRINEELIDRASERRALLLRMCRVGRRRMITVVIAAAVCVCILAGTVAGLLIPHKQTPVYLGMTVSSEAPTPSAAIGYSPDSLLLSSEPMTVGTPGVTAASELYYAKPGQDIYITIHVDNPDNFEIQSFTLNGKTYSAYMFERGSDMENLILKYNVGKAEGEIVEYTLDAIKYIDGERIKDVRLDGERTVKVGIYTESQPTASLTDATVEHESVSLDVSIEDEYSLIETTGGEVYALLLRGERELARTKLPLGETARVTFDKLTPGESYRIGVLARYDAFDGEGFGERMIGEIGITARAYAEISSVSASDGSVSFELSERGGVSLSVERVELLLGDRVIASGGPSERSLVAMPGKYVLLVTYTYDNGGGRTIGYVRYDREIEVKHICEIGDIVASGSISKNYSGSTQVHNPTTQEYLQHKAIDIRPGGAELGVRAAFSGRVSDVRDDPLVSEGGVYTGGLGRIVEITSEDGRFVARYCGLDAVTLKRGDSVSAGDVVGLIGELPLEALDGAHLHLELTLNGEQVDPSLYIR